MQAREHLAPVIDAINDPIEFLEYSPTPNPYI